MPSSLSVMALHVLFGACRHGDTPCQRPAECCIALNDQEGRRSKRVERGVGLIREGWMRGFLFSLSNAALSRGV